MTSLNIDNGTFKHCSNCKLKKNCCCDFTEIDNVVTTVHEKEQIVKKLGKFSERHFFKINDEAYNILNVDGVCPFYNNGCTIYDIRPCDCRLFPYDIKEIGGKYYLIQYELSCGSKNVNENVEEVVKELSTIITTYTDKKIGEKVNNLKYKVIKEIGEL